MGFWIYSSSFTNRYKEFAKRKRKSDTSPISTVAMIGDSGKRSDLGIYLLPFVLFLGSSAPKSSLNLGFQWTRCCWLQILEDKERMQNRRGIFGDSAWWFFWGEWRMNRDGDEERREKEDSERFLRFQRECPFFGEFLIDLFSVFCNKWIVPQIFGGS